MRPQTKPAKECRITIRLSAEEAESYQAQAQTEGRTLSEWIRLQLAGRASGETGEIGRLREMIVQLEERRENENDKRGVRDVAATVDRLPASAFGKQKYFSGGRG
jgi:hypothetical protein